MALTKRQKELDQIKWEKSVAQGSDACGSFDYCAVCNKNLENPCDKAFAKFNKKPAEKKAVAKKPVAKKAEASKTVAKKPAAKKTAKKEVAATKA